MVGLSQSQQYWHLQNTRCGPSSLNCWLFWSNHSLAWRVSMLSNGEPKRLKRFRVAILNSSKVLLPGSTLAANMIDVWGSLLSYFREWKANNFITCGRQIWKLIKWLSEKKSLSVAWPDTLLYVKDTSGNATLLYTQSNALIIGQDRSQTATKGFRYIL